MSLSIRQFLYMPIGMYRTYKKAKSRIASDQSRLFLLNIPSHGNLGDHLLSVAEQQFLRDFFPEKEVVLVSSGELFFSVRLALMDVTNKDILCVTGGGFMGSLYQEEKRILSIIQRFPNNKILFFPQTFYYDNTSYGEKLIKKAAKIYQLKPKVYLVAREQQSFELIINRLMPFVHNRVFLMPDIALYLRLSQHNIRRGILWCMRSDTEILKKNAFLINLLKQKVKKTGIEERYTDTYVDYSIRIEDEYIEVMNKVNEISSAQLVITDRLHGMIYSIITGTPVIALDNFNQKISLTHELWLQEIPYVRFVHDAESIHSSIKDLLELGPMDFDNTRIKTKYQPLINIINGTI